MFSKIKKASAALAITFLVLQLAFINGSIVNTTRADETSPDVVVTAPVDTSVSQPTTDTVVTETSTDAPADVTVSTDAPVVTDTPATTDVVATDSSDTTTAVTTTDSTVSTDTTTSDSSDLPAASSNTQSTTVVAPTLSTDKADYNPGQTATIFGNLFQSLQTIVLKIFGGSTDNGTYTESTQNVTTDANGSFATTYTLDNVFRPIYNVIASNLNGDQLAQTSFTDTSVSMWLQCENHKTATVGNCGWTGGNLTAAHNSLFEGMATHQEVMINGLGAGAHTLRFGIQTTKSGNHAYDWIVSDAQALQAASEDGITTTLNPCTGGTNPENATCLSLYGQIGSNHATPSVPDDSFVSQDGSTQSRITAYEAHFGNRTIDLYSNAAITGATLALEGHCSNKTGVSCNVVATSTDTGDTYVWYSLTWTSTGADFLMRTAADIALGGNGTGRSWGAGRGATGVSGSPYHFFLNTIDGVGGSLDNQMAAGAVFTPPGSLTIRKVTVPSTSTPAFTFNGTNLTPSSVVLHDQGTNTWANLTNGTTYTVTEASTTGWRLSTSTPVSCTGQASSTITNVANGVSVALQQGENITCTFTNVIALVAPNVTTNIHDAGHNIVTSVSAGTTVHDSVSVTGSNGTATGNVVFNWYTNNSCSGAAAATSSAVALSGGNADATAFPQGPLSVGSYSFKASYAGDSNYFAAVGSCEPLAVTKVSPSISTTPNPASGTIGVVLNDTATLSGGYNPTGNVTFKLFAPSDATCSGVPAYSDTDGTASYATSPGFVSNAVGTWHWTADYAGDANNNATSSGCSAEPVTVGKASPSLSTDIHNASHNVVTSVPAGSTVHDSATVSGGSSPTGNVTFSWYTNNTCNGTAATTSSAVALSGTTADGTSFPQGPLNAGNYSFKAHYNGDANNNAADASCEPLTVTKLDSNTVTAIHNDGNHSTDVQNTTLSLASTIHDQATVSGSFGTPTGSVTFQYFTNGTCEGSPTDTSSAQNLTGGVVDATGFAKGPLGAGSYSFKATYGGDTNYNSSTGACEMVSVNKGNTSVVTHVHNPQHADITNSSVASGTLVHDAAVVGTQVDGLVIGGTVTYHFYSNYTCSNATTSDQTVTMSGGDAPESTPQALGAGSYSYLAEYSGNANYNGSTGVCEPFKVVDATITLSPLTATNAVGQNHVITATVTQNDGTGVTNAPNGTTVSFSITNSNGATATFVGLASCTTTAGQCSVTINSPTAGSVAIHATTTFSVGGVSLTRATGDGISGDSVDAAKTYVDAQIMISASSTNEVGQDHTFTVTVKKDVGDGAGFVAAAGETVVGSISGIGSIVSSTCATTDGSGQCAIVVHSATAGVGTVHASTTITIGSVSLTRATGDGISGDSSDTTKTWVDGSISLTPQEATNKVGDPHTITAHVTKNSGSGPVDASGVTVDFSITGGANFVGSNSCVTSATGTCSIVINSTSTGSNTIDATATFSVNGLSITRATNGNSGPDGSDSAEKAYVNARISISPATSTNEVNDDHIFVVTVEQDSGSGFVPVTAGTLANATSSPTPTSFDASDCTNGVDANGQCNVVINSSVAGVFTITARSTVVVGGVTFKLQTNGVGSNSGPATKTYVDARIVLSPLTATNNIGDAHTITATVSQNTGSGFVAAPDGTLVTFSLLNNTALADFIPTSGSNTCTTTGGTCSVQINTLTPGSVDIHATTTFSVLGVSLTRATGDGLSGDSANANKLYVAGALDITKALNVSNYPVLGLPNVDGTFTFHIVGPSYPSGTDQIFTMVDGVLQAPTTIHLSPLIPGNYTVTENNPGIAWTVIGEGSVSVVANQTSTKTITNTIKRPHTTISIQSNTQETLPGENVILTITDTNDGDVPLNNPSVVLTYGSTTTILTSSTLPFSGDTNGDGIMNVGETWTWTVTVMISADTTFNVAGHGTDSFGTDITPATGVTSEGGSTTVKVVGTTRTLGFWQTHTNFTTYVYSTYGITVGNNGSHKGPIDTAAKVFGGFYAPIAKTTLGAKRAPEDQARITLLQQLLAAKLNCAAFGCSATVQGQITAADAAYAAGNKNTIMSFVSILDAYNNSGDANAIPASLPATGKATPSVSKSTANMTFWDLP